MMNATNQALLKPSAKKGRWQRYVFMGLVVNSAIWGATLFFLKVAKPTYISEWALILPGSGPGVSVNLPDIGQASSSSSSPFGGPTQDPRANYQFIATSETVIKKAAAIVHLPPEKFGEPKIKLLDNTTIMKFQVTGSSAEEARQKSLALYKALVSQLTLLRVEELARRDDGIQSTLESAKAKLVENQQRLSAYKLKSGLSFPGQIDNLSVNVEQLRRQRAELVAQQQQVGNRLQQLSTSLKISPQQAASAFVLQADQLFQQNLKDYSEASANLPVLLAKWGDNHPNVIKEKARLEAAQAAISNRSQSLLGNAINSQMLGAIQLTANESGRASLFRDLVAVQADFQGLTAEAQAIDQQIKLLESRLNGLAQGQTTLENMKREMQTAEAVFASTVAKLDLGKSDIFTAYPLIQMVQEPSLPDKASAPKKSLVIAGAAIGSLFSSGGFALLWWRKRLMAIARNPKSSASSLPALPIDPILGSEKA
jgi:uncharacterized protein involved in exopolysaccharide biosynthesis